MTASRLRAKVVAERVSWVRAMVAGIRSLPCRTLEEFLSDPRNPAAAESYLRRALEALLDLGRHLLAKGFGRAVSEYKEIPAALVEEGVLSADEGSLLRLLAGYRNRMVHCYHEVGQGELYALCTDRLDDIPALLGAMAAWVEKHPESVDDSL